MPTKPLALGLILLAALLLTACPSRTTISKINSDPGRYNKKEVAIAGTVTDSYGFLNQGVYEVDDGTGRMWVVTSRGVPSKGTRIGVKGNIYQGFNLGGRNFGTAMEEKDRRAETR